MEPFDIAVVGTGPCGIGVGIAARRAGVSCILFDKSCVASSISRYPTYMTFFSTAERLEIGEVPFTIAGDKPVRREALNYYQRLVRHFELNVHQYENVTAVESHGDGFGLQSLTHAGEARSTRARNVVLATGYFDHPNRLNVPGEDLPKVSHGYREGHPFFDQDCVIVGGGNSAVDAALELNRWGARVTLVHFESALDRGVKPWVLPDITARINGGEIGARWGCRVAEIRPQSVVVRHDRSGQTEEIRNDWVLAMTGYTPDPVLLRGLGVTFHPDTGIPRHDPMTMETDVPGVFIAGVIAAGNNANKVFIENGRDHGARIVERVVATKEREGAGRLTAS
jgi:thioredoxin reductase (NADPH)